MTVFAASDDGAVSGGRGDKVDGVFVSNELIVEIASEYVPQQDGVLLLIQKGDALLIVRERGGKVGFLIKRKKERKKEKR